MDKHFRKVEHRPALLCVAGKRKWTDIAVKRLLLLGQVHKQDVRWIPNRDVVTGKL